MKDTAPSSRSLTRIAIGFAVLALACGRSEQEALEALPPAFQSLEGEQPETPVVAATVPPKRVIEPVRVDSRIPQVAAEEMVRLTRDGLLVDRAFRFDARVLAVGPDSLALSNGYVLSHRLPEGHELSVEPGQGLTVHFLPTSVGGSDEVSVTLYEAAGQERAGSIVLQTVQRGGFAPVRIVEESFIVEQLAQGETIQETESEVTIRPSVRLTASRNSWRLDPHQPFDFSAAGERYRVTLLRSLHFEPKAGAHSVEGPSYILEYIVTRISE